MTKWGDKGKNALHRDCLSLLPSTFFPPLIFMPASHLEVILAAKVRREEAIREGGNERDGPIKGRGKGQDKVPPESGGTRHLFKVWN